MQSNLISGEVIKLFSVEQLKSIKPKMFKVLDVFHNYGYCVRLETLEDTILNQHDKLLARQTGIEFGIKDITYHYEDDWVESILFKKGSIFLVTLSRDIGTQVSIGDFMARIENKSANNKDPQVITCRYMN